MQTSSKKLSWALGGISLFRIGYMLFALAPWVRGSFLTPALLFFISMYALVAIPIQFFNIGNVGMMIDLVPEDRRAAVFTVRNVIGSLVNIFLLNVGMWMVGPLYVLYTVRQLAASDAWIGTAGTIASICSLVGWLAGRRLIEWWGDAVTHRRLV